MFNLFNSTRPPKREFYYLSRYDQKQLKSRPLQERLKLDTPYANRARGKKNRTRLIIYFIMLLMIVVYIARYGSSEKKEIKVMEQEMPKVGKSH